MDVASSEAKGTKQLPDLDALDMEALKALVLAQQSALDSRAAEIENLKLLILKLKRMHFGPRSEKFSHDIEQLELRLEDLEANRSAAEPLPAPPATIMLNDGVGSPHAVRCHPNCRAKPKRLRQPRKRARTAAARSVCSVKMYPRCSNTFLRASKLSARCGRS
jgi:hypothetical protein